MPIPEFDIFPVILAAGASTRLGFPKPLARFGECSALDIAIRNCSALPAPVIVLGCQARRVRVAIPNTTPRSARVVVNRRWRSGQLTSLLAGLKYVPRRAPFMVYPVDYPLLTPALIGRIAAAFRNRRKGEQILVPQYGGRAGHPVIFAHEIRAELRTARTARDVTYWRKSRVRFLRVETPAIWQDFSTPASYRQCLREYQRFSQPGA